MTISRKRSITALLKGIESGDESSVLVVNQDKYIQHNPQTQEGGEGLAVLFKRLSKRSPTVNIVRIFSDADYVFAHTEYNFGSPRVGFEIFRFEGEQTVEHWDNIQLRKGPNKSAHSMVDGTTESAEQCNTETNRALVKSFVQEVLLSGHVDKIADFVNQLDYIEHSPDLSGSLSELRHVLNKEAKVDETRIDYQKTHRILADGNFVLTVNEGFKNGNHTSFYDLFRVANGKLVEHWDTTEIIPPKSEWKNNNGKF